MKELRFVGTSLVDLSRFPTEAKRAAGFELWQVQNGLDPSDWKPMKSKVTKSSGNVFADLGFAPEEVAVLTLRAELMVMLRKLIAARGWTQAQAADELGVTQSRVSDLVRGKHEKFSLDMLVTLAARAGRTVKLRLAA